MSGGVFCNVEIKRFSVLSELTSAFSTSGGVVRSIFSIFSG